MATKKKTEKKKPVPRKMPPQSVIQRSFRLAKGEVTDEVKQAVIDMVKSRGEIKTTFFLKNRKFDEKDIESMVEAGVKAAKKES